MKRTSYAPLLEMAVMIPVFALICAGALQLFAWAGSTAKDEKAYTMASLAAAAKAEELKSLHQAQSCTVRLDADFRETKNDPSYTLQVEPKESGQPLLGRAVITVKTAQGGDIYRLECAWQEAPHE